MPITDNTKTKASVSVSGNTTDKDDKPTSTADTESSRTLRNRSKMKPVVYANADGVRYVNTLSNIIILFNAHQHCIFNSIPLLG